MRNVFERYRSLFSWILALPILAFLLIYPGDEILGGAFFVEGLGIFMIIVAALGRIWASLYICGRKDSELVTDGPFSLCRNPLYLFSFIGAEGVMLTARNFPLAVLMIPLFWGYYHFVIKGEEKRLAELFGPDYEAYRRNTPKIFPRFSNYNSRKTVEIDLGIMKSALFDAGYFLVLIALIRFLELGRLI